MFLHLKTAGRLQGGQAEIHLDFHFK
ncbi:hypothetical protein CL3_06310 [butyrate-producing bacterium SM4/1]|nr:hypothetical protein CLS_31240 [[Clostridium] cf. saccharolyticum K10]CBL35733.1 hypothetical protein CL3_06310 [butyrate-producing bacterium SM4/1]